MKYLWWIIRGPVTLIAMIIGLLVFVLEKSLEPDTVTWEKFWRGEQ